MNTPSSAQIKNILSRTKVIGAVGMSTNPIRPSYFVGQYLVRRNIRVIAVNPAYAGAALFGETVLSSLSELPPEVDFLDVFRRSEALPEIVEDALAHLPNLKTIWMQLGVSHADAAARARAAGIDVIEDRCPKIEYQRLFGELSRAGINTGIISSKL